MSKSDRSLVVQANCGYLRRLSAQSLQMSPGRRVAPCCACDREALQQLRTKTRTDILILPATYARFLPTSAFPVTAWMRRKRQAGLRLDLRPNAIVTSTSGSHPIVPGNPDASLLLRRVKDRGALQMPPENTGKRLTPARNHTCCKNGLRRARFTNRTGLFTKPVQLPALPIVKNTDWARNPLDSFILTRLEKEGITPSPPADRYTLLRRVCLDLTGLPPTPQQVQTFLADNSPDAYEKVVDELLASPHYGKKWARMWLDLARFADSAGYGSDPLRPNLWPYRDWVINAFNQDMPYDRFIVEQIAGDLLPNPTKEQLVATAFHRNTMTNTEGGTSREEFRTAAVKDRAITTAQVFMGLTMGCAQCHSHKFDPISQKEFYSFYALFNQTEDNDQPNEAPTISLPTAEQSKRMAELQNEIADLQARATAMPQLKAELDTKQKELTAIRPVQLPIMRELPMDKRRVSYVLTLSNFLQPAEQVESGTPAAFPPLPTRAPKNRLGVAQWLISPDNPLTARVAVNRIWAQLFGTGLVETEEDFGLQGALPTHPELLDWLAVRFAAKDEGGRMKAENGSVSSLIPHPLSLNCAWSPKKLLRMLVTSATYRQSSRTMPQLLEKDPRNRLLGRYPRRRLEAELVRDQALALSGLLSAKIGGPSVFPPQPGGLWQAAFNGDRNYPTSTGEDRYRRGLYTFWRRTVPYPSMAAFDAPSREICTMRRTPTNTPLQALVTLNDPVYVEMAQAFGRRIVREGGATLPARVHYALALVQSRPPRPEDVQTLTGLYEKELVYYRSHADDAKRLATEPLGPLPNGIDAAEQAAWTVVGNVLLNLDGVLNKS